VLAAVTVVGESICGFIEVGALIAGAVATAADFTLAAEGRGSWWNVGFDVAGMAFGGGGFWLKSLRTESGLAEGVGAFVGSPMALYCSFASYVTSFRNR
jgi:hypothetical protein